MPGAVREAVWLLMVKLNGQHVPEATLSAPRLTIRAGSQSRSTATLAER